MRGCHSESVFGLALPLGAGLILAARRWIRDQSRPCQAAVVGTSARVSHASEQRTIVAMLRMRQHTVVNLSVTFSELRAVLIAGGALTVELTFQLFNTRIRLTTCRHISNPIPTLARPNAPVYLITRGLQDGNFYLNVF